MSKMSLLTGPELKNLEALLRCPICFDCLNIAMMTKCSHNFCSLCIRKALSYKLRCPVCNSAMTEVDLRNNRILDDLAASCRAARLTIWDLPSVSPKILSPNLKRKAPNARQPVVENTSSSSLLKRPKLQPACNKSRSIRLLQFPRTLKVEVVKLPLHVTGTVKIEDVEVPVQVTRTVKKELVEVAATGSTSSSEFPSTSQSVKAVVAKVECPVCSMDIDQLRINRHLDSCLIREAKKDSLRSAGSKRKPLPKLVYTLLSIQELKKRLKECHLSTQGSREQLITRHQEFVHMYNAECDSLTPMSAHDIANEVERNERMRAQLQSKSRSVLVFSEDQTIEEIQEMHSSYRKQHSAEFSRLIAQVKGQWKASRRTQIKDEALEGGSEPAGGGSLRPAAAIEGEPDTKPHVSRDSSEDPAEERVLKSEPVVRSLSPTFSDVSISSSISDVFSVEAERNNELVSQESPGNLPVRNNTLSLSSLASPEHSSSQF